MRALAGDARVANDVLADRLFAGLPLLFEPRLLVGVLLLQLREVILGALVLRFELVVPRGQRRDPLPGLLVRLARGLLSRPRSDRRAS